MMKHVLSTVLAVAGVATLAAAPAAAADDEQGGNTARFKLVERSLSTAKSDSARAGPG